MVGAAVRVEPVQLIICIVVAWAQFSRITCDLWSSLAYCFIMYLRSLEESGQRIPFIPRLHFLAVVLTHCKHACRVCAIHVPHAYCVCVCGIIAASVVGACMEQDSTVVAPCGRGGQTPCYSSCDPL